MSKSWENYFWKSNLAWEDRRSRLHPWNLNYFFKESKKNWELFYFVNSFNSFNLWNKSSFIWISFIIWKKWYRVSHETWQLVNSFERLLPYTVLYIEDFSQFISLKKSFSQIFFTLKSNLLFYKCHMILFIILFGIKPLNKL